jgi:hypothetical protein
MDNNKHGKKFYLTKSFNVKMILHILCSETMQDDCMCILHYEGKETMYT